MRVIFLEDVPNVAKAGETKEVADGYGRNFLIPKKLALLLNLSTVKAVDNEIKARARQQAKSQAELLELAHLLEGKEITLKAKAGAKERLYGSVTSADIAAELETSARLIVDKRKIELAEPIHHLGSYEVSVRLGKDMVPSIKVNVVEEKD